MNRAWGMHVTVLLAAVFAAAGAHAQQAPHAATRTPSRVPFTATDSTLRGPAFFNSGTVTVQLANKGKAPHVMHLVAIGPGHSYEQALSQLRSSGRMPSWTAMVIGVGPVDPGRTSAVTLNLDAVNYFAADLLTRNGKSNYLAGLTAPLEGRGESVMSQPNLPADGGLLVSDRSFRFGAMLRSGDTWRQVEGPSRLTQIRAGTRTIRINAANAVTGHTIVLARGGPEVMRDYASWLDGRRPTPPPLFGGIANMPPGQMVYLEVTVPLGPYVLFCTTRHARYGTLGYESGEFAQFVVR